MNNLKYRGNKFIQHSQWCVITGAPCSGKTTIINELERRGYMTIAEVARAHIEKELTKGKSISEIRSDESSFQNHILHEKLKLENSLSKQQIIFFDRGVPDSIGYFKFHKLDYAQVLRKSLRIRYKKVYFLERLRFQNDAIRSETEEDALLLQHLILNAYEQLGYEPVHIPEGPVSKRLDLILKHI